MAGACAACPPDCLECTAKKASERHSLYEAQLPDKAGIVHVCHLHFTYGKFDTRLVAPQDAINRALSRRYAQLRAEFTANAYDTWDHIESDKKLAEMLAAVTLHVPDLGRDGIMSERWPGEKAHPLWDSGVLHIFTAIAAATAFIILGTLGVLPFPLDGLFLILGLVLLPGAQKRISRNQKRP